MVTPVFLLFWVLQKKVINVKSKRDAERAQVVPRISLFADSLPGLNRQAKPGKLAVKVLGTGADLRQSSDSEST